jgi:NAD(P)-dependent dehydrogenase (short-subunit alcohol dehydrogenase family)
MDLAEPASAPDGVSWMEADVADEGAWERVVSRIESEHGRLDGLVNAAGISDSADTIDDCTPDIWQRILAVNLDGTFLGCKHAVRAMRRLGTDDGSIVNFSSVLGTTATGATTAYSASKAGVRQLTKSIALYLAREHLPIRCNSVHPGYIETRMTTDWLDEVARDEGRPVEDVRAELEALHPLGRLGRARDVAETVAFLLSRDASYVNGSEVVVDGGYLAI